MFIVGLVSQLKARLDSLVDSIDYRQIDHSRLSQSLAGLTVVLKKHYFDSNPLDSNKLFKTSLFMFLIRLYGHELNIYMQQSM